MNDLPFLLGLACVVSLLTAFSLWENPSDGRPIRQRRAGVFHRLILIAAWWHEFVGGLSVNLAHYPTAFVWHVSKRFSRHVEIWIQWAVCFVLLQEFAWFIAEDYLREKWQAEIDDANRRFVQERTGGQL